MPSTQNISHTEEIFRAAATLVQKYGRRKFSRLDVRKQIGLSAEKWHRGYTSMFQGMIKDCPDSAPKVAKKYRGVFLRIELGIYSFTPYGETLLEDWENLHSE